MFFQTAIKYGFPVPPARQDTPKPVIAFHASQNPCHFRVFDLDGATPGIFPFAPDSGACPGMRVK
jgi:hypothetical protein